MQVFPIHQLSSKYTSHVQLASVGTLNFIIPLVDAGHMSSQWEDYPHAKYDCGVVGTLLLHYVVFNYFL